MTSRWFWGWLLSLSCCWSVADAHWPRRRVVGVPAAATIGSGALLVAYSPSGDSTTVCSYEYVLYFIPTVMVIPPSGVRFVAVPSARPLAPADRGMGVADPCSPPRKGGPFEGPVPRPAPARKSDPRRSIQLVTIGDRLFRGGNTRRAAERYEQAVRAEPNSAVPRIRLSQIAVLRGQYAEAANHYREGLLAHPGWLAKAPDIESINGKPGDFAHQITQLESHLQSNPGDRDAWLVVGAQWFLSGRNKEAGDIFLRLSDHKPDAAIAALLDATCSRNRAQ